MATTKLWTVEELERTPLDGLYELIDGELIEMTPSGGEASNTAMVFGYYLTAHVRPRRLGKVYGADGGFALFPEQQLVRSPDVSFVRADRLPPEEQQQGFLRLAPDLAVEVLSPSDRVGNALEKVAMYLEAGVRLVWLVDPRDRTVTVFAQGQPMHVLREGDALDGGEVLPEFRVPLAEIFA